jgi:hypothetical protein
MKIRANKYFRKMKLPQATNPNTKDKILNNILQEFVTLMKINYQLNSTPNLKKNLKQIYGSIPLY